MHTKLTLRMDEKLIRFAKKYSKETGQSVSSIVANYFKGLEGKSKGSPEEWGPITKSLVGAFEGAEVDEDDYHEYLARKYE